MQVGREPREGGKERDGIEKGMKKRIEMHYAYGLIPRRIVNIIY